jgi:outer membrane biosynthesis protein TonB
MSAIRTPGRQQSSASSRGPDHAQSPGSGGPGGGRSDIPLQYRVPPDDRFAPFLAVALLIFALGTFLGTLLPKQDALPPMIEVDLGIDGIENEPPPLGEPDAGAGEVIEQPVSEPEQPPMIEEVPPPAPEPEPAPEIAPPQPVPEFVIPTEPEPEPKPKPAPKPVAKTETRPKAPPEREAKPGTAVQAGSGLTGARAGVRGSPGGQPGGRGGGRGDFVSTPSPQYDATARQRGYQGRGTFIIRYENGRILSVAAAKSTGVSYLDARTITWIKTRWRVKSGTSGTASLPITWEVR